jgi:hypothetical protein
LVNNSSTVTSLILQSAVPSAIIDYRITRGTDSRSGTIKVAHNAGADVKYDDEYSESANIGVVLEFFGNTTSDTATLRANVSSAGDPAIIRYTVRSFI